MRKVNIILSGFFLIFTMNSYAQSPIREMGKIVSSSMHDQELDIQTENAFVSIIAYSPNVIRVRMDKQKLKSDFSYAVIVEPLKTQVRFNNDPNTITMSTDSVKAVIQKNPFSIAFYNNFNDVIVEDEKGLATSWMGDEVNTYKKKQDGERFIGLGEKTGNLDRAGQGYSNWNSDIPGYTTNQDPLYSSIPFYMGIHQNITYGVFLDNTFQTNFNFGASNDRFSSFGALNGEMNYYLIYQEKVSDIIRSYSWLTGRMKMPPMWSLGYQQCRWTYYPETEVMRIANTLREKKIPADGITLDIHYMDQYQLFTWNKDRFPDPKGMTSRLKQMGFHTTVIVDPGIKVAPGAPAFENGLKDSVYIKYPDGKYYAGQVWPGWCYFPDFTSAKGRAFWRKEVKFFSDYGVSGIWNDMNEIAVFGNRMPNNVLFDFDGRKATNLEAHNVYGFLMARSSYEGTRENNPSERPFVLTRAGYAGLQRYSAIWTGDNVSSDEHMLLGVRLLSSLGLSGVPFTGVDIGGYMGNPSQELYTRWMQLGAFFPYFRNHKAYDQKNAEPWVFGEIALNNLRPYINLRYKLLPYIYSTFYESTQDGMPVVRSLAIENTFEPQVFNSEYQNQFCFGKSIMVVPVSSTADFVKVYFPGNEKWYDLYSDKTENGYTEKIIQLSIQKLPVYIKGGSIIPMQSLVQTTLAKPSDTLYLHMYKGDKPNTFVYYEDDGKSFDYEKGIYYRRSIDFNPEQKEIKLEKVEGEYATNFKNILLVLHGFGATDSIQVNGKTTATKEMKLSFLLPGTFIEKNSPDVKESCEVNTVLIKNESGEISVKY